MPSVASSSPDTLDGWRWDGRGRCSSPELQMMDLHRYGYTPYFEPTTPKFTPSKTEDLGVSSGRIGWELLLGPPKESKVCAALMLRFLSTMLPNVVCPRKYYFKPPFYNLVPSLITFCVFISLKLRWVTLFQLAYFPTC